MCTPENYLLCMHTSQIRRPFDTVFPVSFICQTTTPSSPKPLFLFAVLEICSKRFPSYRKQGMQQCLLHAHAETQFRADRPYNLKDGLLQPDQGTCLTYMFPSHFKARLRNPTGS